MTAELTATPAWTRIHQLWPQFLTLKTSTTPTNDGMPRASSDPSQQAVLNLNILVLEIEITDRVDTHLRFNRKRGGKATTLTELIHEHYPETAPTPEQHVWETAGSDFLEEIESLLGHKPRPWTQHKLDLLAEYPDRFQLTQAQTLIALAALDRYMPRKTLESRILAGTHQPDEHGRLNLADVVATPYTPHRDRHANIRV